MDNPSRPQPPKKGRAAVVLSGTLIRTGPLKRVHHAKLTLVTATVDVNGEEYDATITGDKAVEVSEARMGSQFIGSGKLRVKRWKTSDNMPHQELTIELAHVELAPPRRKGLR